MRNFLNFFFCIILKVIGIGIVISSTIFSIAGICVIIDGNWKNVFQYILLIATLGLIYSGVLILRFAGSCRKNFQCNNSYQETKECPISCSDKIDNVTKKFEETCRRVNDRVESALKQNLTKAEERCSRAKSDFMQCMAEFKTFNHQPQGDVKNTELPAQEPRKSFFAIIKDFINDIKEGAKAGYEHAKMEKAKKEEEERNRGIFMSKAAIDALEEHNLTTVEVPVFLKNSEIAVYHSVASLQITKNRVVGRRGGYGGASVRIAKGLSVHTGRYSGTPVYGDVIQDFSGELIITTQRIIFTSRDKGFEISFAKLTNYSLEGVGVIFQTGSKVYYLSLPRPYLAYSALSIISDNRNDIGNLIKDIGDNDALLEQMVGNACNSSFTLVQGYRQRREIFETELNIHTMNKEFFDDTSNTLQKHMDDNFTFESEVRACFEHIVDAIHINYYDFENAVFDLSEVSLDHDMPVFDEKFYDIELVKNKYHKAYQMDVELKRFLKVNQNLESVSIPIVIPKLIVILKKRREAFAELVAEYQQIIAKFDQIAKENQCC